MISIITATFNAETTISDNLQCIANQSQAASVEHVFVDGYSTDSTVELIKGQSLPGSSLVSEPDHGIYDAMNKGVALSNGSIIGILNADDFYADTKVLNKVSRAFDDPEVDACYGDLIYVRERIDSPGCFDTVRYWKSGFYRYSSFYWGWMPPHPTFFVRKSVYEKYGIFNLDLGSAADYEIMLRFLLKHRIKCAYIPEVIVHMRVGGVSNASVGNRLAANKNDRKAWSINGLKPYPWTLACKPLRKIGQWIKKPPQIDY